MMRSERPRTRLGPRRSRLAQTLVLTAVLGLCSTGVSPAVVQPEPVVTSERGEYGPFANDTYVVYTRDRAKDGHNAIAWSIVDGTVTRLNAPHTWGAVSGIDPGTNRILYRQTRYRGQYPHPTRSHLFFFDLDTGERTRAPEVDGLPRISSTYLLFATRCCKEVSLNLLERETGEQTQIASWRASRIYALWLGSVGDRYATYALMREGMEEIGLFLYDAETETRRRIPTNSMPVVDEANSTVYFAESTACGDDPSVIWRLPIDDLDAEPTEIAVLPDDEPGMNASVATNASTGHVDLYMELYDCHTEDPDIYVLRAVDAEPTT